VRVGRSKWFNLLWLLPIGWGALLIAVAAAQGLRNMPAVQRFMARYPGTLIPPGTPLSYGHGAPLRLRNQVQLGFKQVKWLAGIEFVAHYSEVGGGYGGYNPTTSSSATANPSSRGGNRRVGTLEGCRSPRWKEGGQY
jgi:Oxidoreductase molybdopterin binding domain